MNPLGYAPGELERPLISQVSEEIVIIVPDHFAMLQDGHAGRLVAIPHGFKERIPCIETGLHHDTAWKRLVIWRHSSFVQGPIRSEEHTSELQSLMRISYAVFCLKKKISNNQTTIP